MMGRLAVKRCSLSRLGMVDGAKCSFLRIVCLMMFRRSRMASIRDSAEPRTDDGCRALRKQHVSQRGTNPSFILRPLLFEAPPFRGPMP